MPKKSTPKPRKRPDRRTRRDLRDAGPPGLHIHHTRSGRPIFFIEQAFGFVRLDMENAIRISGEMQTEIARYMLDKRLGIRTNGV